MSIETVPLSVRARQVAKSLELIYEDDYCVVFDKKAGLAVQGGSGVGQCVESILKKSYPERLFLVHRLDKATSGLLLTAKGAENARYFGKIFAAKSGGSAMGSDIGSAMGSAMGLEKRYLALCVSNKNAAQLTQSGVLNKKLLVKGSEKESLTKYKILSKFPLKAPETVPDSEFESLWEQTGIEIPPRMTLFDVELVTGRLHQIRRCFALEGYPIAGDDKYGNFRFNKAFRRVYRRKDLFLRAYKMKIPLPNGSIIELNLAVRTGILPVLGCPI